MLETLRPRRFKLRQDGAKAKWRWGFVAQEAHKALETLDGEPVEFYDGEDPEHLSLCYMELIAPLVAGYQAQQARIGRLEARLSRLEGNPMLNLDPETQCITCPQGDTGLLLDSITALGRPTPGSAPGWGGGVRSVPADRGRVFHHQGQAGGAGGQYRHHPDQQRLFPGDPGGQVLLDIRIVTDPELAEDGTVICQDETDEVHSLFAGRDGGMPQYIVPGVAVNV